MEYRIIEKIYRDGSSRFFPQRKFLLFWHYFYDCYEEERISYPSLSKAEESIRADIRSIDKDILISEKVHSYKYPKQE